jgi:DNA-binding transcriptional MerR regulator
MWPRNAELRGAAQAAPCQAQSSGGARGNLRRGAGMQYTIGALARAADLPTSTVRYYERSGLLLPESRSDGNYRRYSDASLKRLRFIRAAQANGFTLTNVKDLLRFQDRSEADCGDVQALIEARLEDLDQRLKQLRSVRAVLRASLEECHRGPPSGRCEVLEGLSRGTPVAPGRRRSR